MIATLFRSSESNEDATNNNNNNLESTSNETAHNNDTLHNKNANTHAGYNVCSSNGRLEGAHIAGDVDIIIINDNNEPPNRFLNNG